MVEAGRQAIDSWLFGCLPFAVLFWSGGSVAGKGGGFFSLASLKAAGNAKVNQIGRIPMEHDIARFEVTEDDGWFAVVKVFQRVTEAQTPGYHVWIGQRPFPVQPGFQRLTLYVVHHHVPGTTLTEVLVHPWQVGVKQASEELGFLLKGSRGLLGVFGGEGVQQHLLDRHRAVKGLRICCVIYCAKGTPTQLLAHQVASMQKFGRRRGLERWKLGWIGTQQAHAATQAKFL